VLDASAALLLLFQDEDQAAAAVLFDRLAEGSAIAPVLWTFEVANALKMAEQRGRATSADTAKAMELLAQLPLTLESTAPAMPLLVSVARQYGLSAYDAAYLELALRSGCALATFDKKLTAAARVAGVELVLV
jgi:predicted nucleic acid-binding protein